MTTQQTPANAAANDVIAAFEREFPKRLRSCYILGSNADGSAAPTSDLDLLLIFAGAFKGLAERGAAQQLAASCAERATVELDIEIEDERTLAHGVAPNFKLASLHIYGDDIRDEQPLIPLVEWTRDRMHSSWWRVARLFARPAIITPPIEYPEPNDPFLGYTRRVIRLRGEREAPSTRDLIRLTGWAATALLALDGGVYVPTKRAVAGLFHEHIGGPWDGFITEVYALCRTRWSYLIPESQSERSELRALCERTLLFERYFLARYNPYLIAELQAGGDSARMACDVLRRAPLVDVAVVSELRRLASHTSTRLRASARDALYAYTHIA